MSKSCHTRCEANHGQRFLQYQVAQTYFQHYSQHCRALCRPPSGHTQGIGQLSLINTRYSPYINLLGQAYPTILPPLWPHLILLDTVLVMHSSTGNLTDQTNTMWQQAFPPTIATSLTTYSNHHNTISNFNLETTGRVSTHNNMLVSITIGMRKGSMLWSKNSFL